MVSAVNIGSMFRNGWENNVKDVDATPYLLACANARTAEANEKRECQIFEMYAYKLIAEAQKICVTGSDFDSSITGNVYAFDSTTIDLCLNVFW